MTLFALAMVAGAAKPPLRFGSFVRELYKIGVPLADHHLRERAGRRHGCWGCRDNHTLARFGAQRSLGAVVGLSLIRELGQVAGGAAGDTDGPGSAVTAEIGTMVATEQLDGLRMLIDQSD